MVSHRVEYIIKELCNVLFRFALHALQYLVEEINIISSACLDDLLFRRSTLATSDSLRNQIVQETDISIRHNESSTTLHNDLDSANSWLGGGDRLSDTVSNMCSIGKNNR